MQSDQENRNKEKNKSIDSKANRNYITLNEDNTVTEGLPFRRHGLPINSVSADTFIQLFTAKPSKLELISNSQKAKQNLESNPDIIIRYISYKQTCQILSNLLHHYYIAIKLFLGTSSLHYKKYLKMLTRQLENQPNL